jgi:hypothetical protein
MRDILNLLETILITEKARGLLYRDPGDVFFQGNLESPSAQITFEKVEYFPSIPGEYATPEEIAQAVDQVESTHPNIVWSNTPRASKGFAVLTFDGPAKGQKTYFGRFFATIKADMSSLWGNADLPGGWQLNKQTSLKGSYFKLKPADLFPPESRFNTPADCVEAMGTRAGTTADQLASIDKIRPGMAELLTGKFPTFENVGVMSTAVRDDLGETIGPIALIQGMPVGTGAEAARKDILGPKGSYANSSIYFPASKINGLVDSYITTPDGTEIGISSKGEEGAKASVKNIADGIAVAREKNMTSLLKKYANEIKIIERVGTMSSTDFPLTFGVEQGLITQDQADKILDIIKSGTKDLNTVKLTKQDRAVFQEFMSAIKAQLNNPRYNVGFHILSRLAALVSANINTPKFGEAALKFLNTSPIIQLHMNVSGKDTVKVTGFTSKYPPNFTGTVGLDASKVYSATGTNGRVSFSYNGGAEEPPAAVAPTKVSTQDLDTVTQQRSGLKASTGGVEKKLGTPKTLGRKRQK